MTGNLPEAEELVQDAFVALLGRWAQLRDPHAGLQYLRRVIVNGGRGEWRRRRRDIGRVERAAAAARVGSLEAGRHESLRIDLRVDVVRALAELPARKRACVLLRHYADLSEAEVAALLEISVGTVKSQTAKGLRQLAVLLSDQGER